MLKIKIIFKLDKIIKDERISNHQKDCLVNKIKIKKWIIKYIYLIFKEVKN